MRDDFLSPDWANHHGKLSSALHQLLASISDSFCVLHHYHFDAPWQNGRKN